ncbi:MAG: hypothetical protein ACLRRK_07790 [Parasutterella sp.]
MIRESKSVGTVVVMFDQILTELHHVLRLASVKPDVFDDVQNFSGPKSRTA